MALTGQSATVSAIGAVLALRTTALTPPVAYSKVSGDANLGVLNGNATTAALIAGGATQTMIVRATVGNRAVQFPVALTGSVIPLAPTSLAATAGINQITITWVDGDPVGGTITGNNIYLNDGTGEVLNATISTGSPYIITGLTNGTNYTVRVTTITDIGGEGPKSATASAMPVATPGPVVNDITLYVGNRTRTGHGGVSLNSTTLGVLTSGSVSAWNLVRTSGDATAWGTNLADGETPKPLRVMTPSDASTTATWQIWADGVNTGKVLTIAMEGAVADGYTISKPAEIDSASTGLRASAVKSALGGRRILFQRGSESKWNVVSASSESAGQIASFRGFNTHTGTFSLESSDAAHPTKIGRIYIIGGKGIVIDGAATAPIIPARSMTAYPASGLGVNHSNNQNIAMIHLSYNPSFTVTDLVNGVSTTLANSNITIQNLAFQHDGLNNQSDTTTWVTGLAINGNTAGSTAGQSANINVYNNTFARVKDAQRYSEMAYSTISFNVVDRFCSNAMFAGGANFSHVTISDGVHKRPFFNLADTKDHQDFGQIGSQNVRANYDTVTISRMKFLTLDGDSAAQGNFWDDFDKYSGASGAALNGGANLTGFQAVNCSIDHILYEGPYLNGLTLGFGTGWSVSHVTLIRGKHPNLILRSPDINRQKVLDPTFRLPVQTETVSGTQHGPVGTMDHCAGHATQLGGAGSPWMVETSDVLYGNFPLNTSPGGYNMQDSDSTSSSAAIAEIESTRQSFYATWFQMGGSGDPEIEARPKVGGPLDLGGGQWVGALKSDGSWA